MIDALLSALVKDILHFLKKEVNFFALPEADRKRRTAAPKLILVLSERDFVDSLGEVVRWLHVEGKSTMPKTNPFLSHLASYLLHDFTSIFDLLGRAFYQSGKEERRERLMEILPGQSFSVVKLREILLVLSPQEVTEAITEFLKTAFGAPLILVQSPAECSELLRTDIRRSFAVKFPHSFVVFQVNAQLIGGLRFFVNGRVHDHSWFAQIQKIHHFSHL